MDANRCPRLVGLSTDPKRIVAGIGGLRGRLAQFVAVAVGRGDYRACSAPHLVVDHPIGADDFGLHSGLFDLHQYGEVFQLFFEILMNDVTVFRHSLLIWNL